MRKKQGLLTKFIENLPHANYFTVVSFWHSDYVKKCWMTGVSLTPQLCLPSTAHAVGCVSSVNKTQWTLQKSATPWVLHFSLWLTVILHMFSAFSYLSSMMTYSLSRRSSSQSLYLAYIDLGHHSWSELVRFVNSMWSGKCVNPFKSDWLMVMLQVGLSHYTYSSSSSSSSFEMILTLLFDQQCKL